MRSAPVIHAVLSFDVASYVLAARASGRGQLDPGVRCTMADLYEDLRRVLAGGAPGIPAGQMRALRIAELVLQNEWKLADPPDERPEPGEPEVVQPTADALPEYRGRRNLSYANMRLLNDVLGVRRHTSDHVIEARCWEAIGYLLGSWLGYERRTALGTERWCARDLPGHAELTERITRLSALRAQVAGRGGHLRAAPAPPDRWSGYAGTAGRANILEYLINVPYGQRHEENAFLRTIHLTEVATWAILARVVSAVEWTRSGDGPAAVYCLDRATALAEIQLPLLRVLRRTLSVRRFLSFRDDTGDSSAVQSIGSQLLHIHLMGLHPRKVEALGAVRENSFLLLHQNTSFTPLWAALDRLNGGRRHGPHGAAGAAGAAGTAGDVLAAAYRLDSALFAWRRAHLGLAYRFLPADTGGSGGTAGAPYLQAFYRDRIFDTDGRLRRCPDPVAGCPARLPVRARPVFSSQN